MPRELFWGWLWRFIYCLRGTVPYNCPSLSSWHQSVRATYSIYGYSKGWSQVRWNHGNLRVKRIHIHSWRKETQRLIWWEFLDFLDSHYYSLNWVIICMLHSSHNTEYNQVLHSFVSFSMHGLFVIIIIMDPSAQLTFYDICY